MTKLYLVTNHSHPHYVFKTEITGAERGPVRIENARGTRPDNPRTLLPRDQEQTASAHGV
jgi:hypothetical protein